jgi:hypothetical protein
VVWWSRGSIELHSSSCIQASSVAPLLRHGFPRWRALIWSMSRCSDWGRGGLEGSVIGIIGSNSEEASACKILHHLSTTQSGKVSAPKQR